jgi:hypothetical protein
VVKAIDNAEVDENLMQECWESWIARDYKPTSLVWLTEWYVQSKTNGSRPWEYSNTRNNYVPPPVSAPLGMTKEQMKHKATKCHLAQGDACQVTIDDPYGKEYCMMCPKWETETV